MADSDDKFYPNEVIREIMTKAKVKHDGESIEIKTNPDYKTGMLLYNIIKDNKLKRTLEIGLSEGINSLFIIQALHSIRGKYHFAIDPDQTNKWRSLGIKNIKKAELAEYFRLIGEKSYVVLPRLFHIISTEDQDNFDLAFINDTEQFDISIVTVFYCDKILSNDGYIVMKNVPKETIVYMKSNDKYEYIDTSKIVEGVFVFKKTSEDKTEWNHHKSFKVI